MRYVIMQMISKVSKSMDMGAIQSLKEKALIKMATGTEVREDNG